MRGDLLGSFKIEKYILGAVFTGSKQYYVRYVEDLRSPVC